MKWIKHMTDSLDDPFVNDLIDEFGVHGYLLWFGLLEIVAKESGHNPDKEVAISMSYLRRKLRTSQAKAELFLTFCVGFGKVSLKKENKSLFIKVPNLLKIRDNHTKNLQVTGKKVSLEAEEDKEVEAEVDKEKKKRRVAAPLLGDDFNKFWKVYPRKKNKHNANTSFMKISPDEILLEKMLTKINQMLSSGDWDLSKPKFIPHATTWLNGKCWEDEIDTAKKVVSKGDRTHGELKALDSL